jgi:hypothetical protein
MNLDSVAYPQQGYVQIIEEIPILGGIFEDSLEAQYRVLQYLEIATETPTEKANSPEVILSSVRQSNGLYHIEIKLKENIIDNLNNIDELSLKKFNKSFAQKRYFILSAFYKAKDDIDSVLINQGLGIVIYK